MSIEIGRGFRVGQSNCNALYLPSKLEFNSFGCSSTDFGETYSKLVQAGRGFKHCTDEDWAEKLSPTIRHGSERWCAKWKKIDEDGNKSKINMKMVVAFCVRARANVFIFCSGETRHNEILIENQIIFQNNEFGWKQTCLTLGLSRNAGTAASHVGHFGWHWRWHGLIWRRCWTLR